MEEYSDLRFEGDLSFLNDNMDAAKIAMMDVKTVEVKKETPYKLHLPPPTPSLKSEKAIEEQSTRTSPNEQNLHHSPSEQKNFTEDATFGQNTRLNGQNLHNGHNTQNAQYNPNLQNYQDFGREQNFQNGQHTRNLQNGRMMQNYEDVRLQHNLSNGQQIQNGQIAPNYEDVGFRQNLQNGQPVQNLQSAQNGYDLRFGQNLQNGAMQQNGQQIQNYQDLGLRQNFQNGQQPQNGHNTQQAPIVQNGHLGYEQILQTASTPQNLYNRQNIQYEQNSQYGQNRPYAEIVQNTPQLNGSINQNNYAINTPENNTPLKPFQANALVDVKTDDDDRKSQLEIMVLNSGYDLEVFNSLKMELIELEKAKIIMKYKQDLMMMILKS